MLYQTKPKVWLHQIHFDLFHLDVSMIYLLAGQAELLTEIGSEFDMYLTKAQDTDEVSYDIHVWSGMSITKLSMCHAENKNMLIHQLV